MTEKQVVLRAIRSLPAKAGIEEAIERLYLLGKIRRGIAQAEKGQMVSQSEARRRMSRWLP